MKKILSAILLVALLALALVGCGDKGGNNDPVEKDYKLSIAVDSVVSGTKITNTAVALVTDADGKIVACRLDCAEASLKLADGELATVANVTTKVELGDAYTGMASGSWAVQAKAFEDFIVGKTAAEVAALDLATVTGCTMSSSMATFKTIIAKAFAYERQVAFKTAGTVTLGLGINASLTGSVADGSAKVAADFAASVLVDGKVAASIIDSNEQSVTLAVTDGALTVTPGTYKGTKNEQGDAYDSYSPMAAGRWYQQAQAYANTANGKTAAEVADLAIDGDAVANAGCTIYAGGYKATLVKAVGNAR